LSSASRHAIAIDLGTTTIAAALVELPSGEVRVRSGSLNPQRRIGLDVISRLEYACRSAEHLAELKRLINDELCRLVLELASMEAIEPAALEQVAIAGNPSMSHLLLGLPVESLAHPPYRPRQTGAHRLTTAELGWPLQIPAYVFPSPGGFVGGDTLAFLYGLGFPEPRTPNPEPALFLDLGTNGEMALLANGKLYATSVAAGPAFEGGNLACGMAALAGAIDTVSFEGGLLSWTTVNAARPAGLCGSGILDTVALLLREGLLDETGRLRDAAEVDSPLGNRLQEIGGERHFVLYRDAARLVSISQGDIRQVQLAKGAVRAGIEVLLERAAVGVADLQEILLTGSFGASLRVESLKSIGILAENMVVNTRFVREGVLVGIVRFVSASGAIPALDKLAQVLRIVPLSGTPVFERRFIENMGFNDR